VHSSSSFASAGGTIVDPTFETTIMRLTDANDGPDCVNAYSYWPTFNINNTRLLVYSGIASLLTDLIRGQFRNHRRGCPGYSYSIRRNSWLEDRSGSGSDPDVIYAHDNLGMHYGLYNAATQTYTLIADFTPSTILVITCGR